MNQSGIEHLDASRIASKARRIDTPPLGLPDDRWAGLRDGDLRADGLLASRLVSELVALAGTDRRDAQAIHQAEEQLWCVDGCSACDAPSVLGQAQVQELAEQLDRMPLRNKRAKSWIEATWQAQRSLIADEVTSSGLLRVLDRTMSGEGDLHESELLLALARLLAGPPATRVRLMCMGLPGLDELSTTIDLPDGWQGGGFPVELFKDIAPHPACWPEASYFDFDLIEARHLWWAWKLEPGCVPQLPDLFERWYSDGFRPPTDAERLIALLHQITFPEPVQVVGRFLAYTGHGLTCLEGNLRATYREWEDPWDCGDPLGDNRDLDGIDWYEDEYFEAARVIGDRHADFLAELAALVADVAAAARPIRRIARAADHLSRTDGRRRDEGGRTALELSIALELLLNDGSRLGEITNSLEQRAALLVGGPDDERRATAQLVGDLYALSSSYRHGAELPVELEDTNLVAGKRRLDVGVARRMIRQVALSMLALNVAGHETRDLLADAAISRDSARLIDEAVARIRTLAGVSLGELDEPATHGHLSNLRFVITDDDSPESAEVIQLRPGHGHNTS